MAGRVGTTRAIGARLALAKTGSRPDETWIANTDADSQVPINWITAMVGEADHGAHLVLGTVIPGDDTSPAARRRWMAHHHLVEGHPYIHGANFSIRADAYRSLGG